MIVILNVVNESKVHIILHEYINKCFSFLAVLGVNDSSLIETITNENSFDKDPAKPVVFGGVLFENMQGWVK